MSNSITSVTTGIPSVPSPATPAASSSPQGDGGFFSSLTNAIDQVEQVHTDAQQQISDLLQGNRQDVHNVMIAVEKADVYMLVTDEEADRFEKAQAAAAKK